MGQAIMLLISFVMLTISVIFIYSARKIATKHFSRGEINTATKALKIVGFILSIISILIIYKCMV